MIKVGIFFGGKSREREISFAGGRTVYDNLDKQMFEPVPVFCDSTGRFIILDWQHVYKGSIRDFYPPVEYLPATPHGFQVYPESISGDDVFFDNMAAKVGQLIAPHQFKKYFDFAFLALHGPYGEDGNIQGLLEWYDIPYSGSGIFASSVGINKTLQKELMQHLGFPVPAWWVVSKKELYETFKSPASTQALLAGIASRLGTPFVVKSPNQGSSLGVSTVTGNDAEEFKKAVYKSLFAENLSAARWNAYEKREKIKYVRELCDLRTGIGLPMTIAGRELHHPEELWDELHNQFSAGAAEVFMESLDTEESVLFESFVAGKEFSCIVIRNEEGAAVALPPTEIIKGGEVFDYRSKYLPGLSRKVTPIRLETPDINAIRHACEQLFNALHFGVYARLDGFVTDGGDIFLNDPNTTSGMMPSSFFFHQAAEIGLNPSKLLTFIIRRSLDERMAAGRINAPVKKLAAQLDSSLLQSKTAGSGKLKVAVIMGGWSSERHISVESGRNIYEKLASSVKYEPVPVFLTGNAERHELYILPVQIMLKDNADDIKEKTQKQEPTHPVIEQIREECRSVIDKFNAGLLPAPVPVTYTELAEMCDSVFIALHGRPGEDGSLQEELKKVGLPFNGSDTPSSSITINKYRTNELLAENGVLVAAHYLLEKQEYAANPEAAVLGIEQKFAYPFIAKPHDDGCSSAVKKIKNRAELSAFCEMMFRAGEEFPAGPAQVLNLRLQEEFPQKEYILFEELIDRKDAAHFLEVTGGLLTSASGTGTPEYLMFEASETPASGEVLSLEEKFLAGEGQNITPARYAANPIERQQISEKVKAELKKVCEILNVEGYARIDAFVRIYSPERVEVIVIEVNSLPGMTPATCIFHQAALAHLKPYNFIDSILEYGKARNSHHSLANVGQ